MIFDGIGCTLVAPRRDFLLENIERILTVAQLDQLDCKAEKRRAGEVGTMHIRVECKQLAPFANDLFTDNTCLVVLTGFTVFNGQIGRGSSQERAMPLRIYCVEFACNLDGPSFNGARFLQLALTETLQAVGKVGEMHGRVSHKQVVLARNSIG